MTNPTIAAKHKKVTDEAHESASIAMLNPNLPDRRPISMPVHSGERMSDVSYRLGARQLWSVWAWRLVMAVATLLLTGFFAYEFYMVLSLNNITIVQAILLALSTISFSWIAFGTATAICGFLALVAASFSKKDELELPQKPRPLSSKNALLFPVYHEDPVRIAATIQAVAQDCADLGIIDNFEFFILSDSRGPQTRCEESRVFQALARRLKGLVPVYFRWREDNYGKKAGNIADWVKNHGGAYDHFVIFDADSIMSAETLLQLAAAMEHNPNAGLIQTVPRLVGGTTIIARLQQFAARMYGPLLAKGSALWHGRDSNYWGHNAIIRCRAFASSAGLPVLKGKPPFGGTIQSHDFIEAAFLRRAGWGVHLMPEMEGSFEGCPPGINEIIVRDQRWCQGNLQHARLLSYPDLKLVSRFHLVTGIMSYLASLFWLMALLAGLVTAYQWLGHEHNYFPDEVALFPTWPVMDAARALQVMLFTAVVVLTPKVLGLAFALFFDPTWGRAVSRLKMIMGFVVEVLLSGLIAPIFMLAHVGALTNLALGRDAGWSAQGREDGRIPLRNAVMQFGAYTLIGLAFAAYCFWISAALAGWLALIYAGLILAPVMAWALGFDSSYLFFDWLVIPDERTPKPVLVHSTALHKQMSRRRDEMTEEPEAAVAAPQLKTA